jgi:hypothetical protein
MIVSSDLGMFFLLPFQQITMNVLQEGDTVLISLDDVGDSRFILYHTLKKLALGLCAKL